MERETPKTFCALAWVHSFVNIGGEYQVCCTADTFSPGITNAEGKVFNIKDSPSLDQVMNSDYMKDLRKKMLNGEWHQACSRCLEGESFGGKSRRNIENDHYQDLIPDLLAMTKEDFSIPIDIKFADYRLGNLCNLQCRMCNPRSSTMWIREWNKIKNPNMGENFPQSALEEFEGYDWIDSPYLLEELRSKVKNLDTLHFAGGEPLITRQMSKMLEICVEEGVAHKILLSYNTNLTRIPEKVLTLWKQFKQVKLLVSVDGPDLVNDYIRPPIKWQIVEKNLRYLDENVEKYNISEILLSTTVQAYNILSLPALYAHLKTYKNVEPALNLVNLYGPVYLRTQILPETVKTRATQELLKVKAELLEILPEHKKYFASNIDQVIGYMTEEDNSQFLHEFLRYTQEIDKLKGMKFSHYLPTLSKLLWLEVQSS